MSFSRDKYFLDPDYGNRGDKQAEVDRQATETEHKRARQHLAKALKGTVRNKLDCEEYRRCRLFLDLAERDAREHREARQTAEDKCT